MNTKQITLALVAIISGASFAPSYTNQQSAYGAMPEQLINLLGFNSVNIVNFIMSDKNFYLNNTWGSLGYRPKPSRSVNCVDDYGLIRATIQGNKKKVEASESMISDFSYIIGNAYARRRPELSIQLDKCNLLRNTTEAEFKACNKISRDMALSIVSDSFNKMDEEAKNIHNAKLAITADLKELEPFSKKYAGIHNFDQKLAEALEQQDANLEHFKQTNERKVSEKMDHLIQEIHEFHVKQNAKK